MAKKSLKKVNGWPDPHGLTHGQLAELAMTLQGILWAGKNGKPDMDQEWSSDEIEAVADALDRAGLKP